MSYVEKNEKDWTKIIGGGILVMLLAAAFKWVVPYFREQASMTDMSTAAGAEREMLADPAVGPIMRVVKLNYPADFDRMRDQVRAASAKRDPATISKAVATTLDQINLRESRHLATAPHDRLDALSGRHLAIVEHLQFRPELCAKFANGVKFGPNEVDPAFSKLLDALVLARVEAFAAGRDQPSRAAARPSAEDIGQFDAALRANGVPGMALELITGKRTAEQATPRMICDAETHFVRAVRALPPEQGDRIYAAAMARIAA
jgi:hypothetical protein